MVQDLKTGTIDGATGRARGAVPPLLDEPGIQARTIDINGFDELGFNCYAGPSRGNPVLKDWKFRQALNYAIDKAQDRHDRLRRVRRSRHHDHHAPDYYTDPDWHWEPPTDVAYAFDLAKATQMLDAAGYKDTDGDGVRDYQGKPITLRLWARSESTQQPEHRQAHHRLVRGHRPQGHPQTMDDGRARPTSSTTTKDGNFTPDYDLFVWGWYSDVDPDSILELLHHGADQRLERLRLVERRSTTSCTSSRRETIDPAQRKAIIDKMQQIIYRESPYIPTVYSNDLEAYNIDKWEGYAASPSKIGNVLFPPYGQAGNENFLLIQPKTATSTAADTGGGTATLWVVIGVAAVIVILLLMLVLRRRNARTEED